MTIMDIQMIELVINVVAQIITGIGIILSFWVSYKAIVEVRKDRVLTQKPFLQFSPGGMADVIELRDDNHASPGFDIELMNELKHDVPSKAKAISRKLIIDGEVSLFGRLINYGNGTAFNIKLVWIAKQVWINSERFNIEGEKANELRYSDEFNTRVVGQFNLLAQESTGILHWPMFIEMDYNQSITRVEGYFIIHYDDLLGNHYKTLQRYHLFTNYTADIPHIHVTFCDVFEDEKDWENIE